MVEELKRKGAAQDKDIANYLVRDTFLGISLVWRFLRLFRHLQLSNIIYLLILNLILKYQTLSSTTVNASFTTKRWWPCRFDLCFNSISNE